MAKKWNSGGCFKWTPSYHPSDSACKLMGETNVDKGYPNFKECPNEGSSTISTESTKMRILQEFSPKMIVALHVRWPAIFQRNVVPLSMDSLLQHFSPQPFWQCALPGSHHANVAWFVRKTSIFSGRIHNQYSHHLPSCKLSDSILMLHSNESCVGQILNDVDMYNIYYGYIYIYNMNLPTFGDIPSSYRFQLVLFLQLPGTTWLQTIQTTRWRLPKEAPSALTQ